MTRTAWAAVLLGVAGGAGVLLVPAGAAGREELLGTAVTLTLLGLVGVVAASARARGRTAAVAAALLVALLAAGLSLATIWGDPPDPVRASRGPAAAWIAALGIAWLAVVVPSRRASRAGAALGWLAAVATLGTGAAAEVALLAEIEPPGAGTVLACGFTVAVVASMGAGLSRRFRSDRATAPEAGFGAPPIDPRAVGTPAASGSRRRGGRHAPRR